MSTSGAVIEGDAPPPVSESVRVVIALPSSGCLVGNGRVVHSHPSAGLRGHAQFAVVIDGFTIERRDAILNGYTPVLHGC